MIAERVTFSNFNKDGAFNNQFEAFNIEQPQPSPFDVRKAIQSPATSGN
jgi:hypothetical protein